MWTNCSIWRAANDADGEMRRTCLISATLRHFDIAVVVHLGGSAMVPPMLRLRRNGSFFFYDILSDGSRA